MAENGRLAVVAVGGNALIVSKDKQSIPDQYEAAAETVGHITDMIAAGWNVVLTHGSGPQVGFILRRSELAIDEVAPVPMDYADADIQGAVGYMFARALHNEFKQRGMTQKPVAVVTQVLVDRKDPAFDDPTKPIGPQLDAQTAKKRAREQGWIIKEDAGRGWRRVVASPHPKAIVELEQIALLVSKGYVVIACGGGGIPVYLDEQDCLQGVEAVVDKDLASSLLALDLEAGLFVILTPVEKVAINFNTRDCEWLASMTLDEARMRLDQGHFDPGSMGPKVEAMIEFLEGGGKKGIITDPVNIMRALEGETGTAFTGT
jgi:carbamate kinase